MFERIKKLRNVFHYEYGSTRPFDNIHKGTPELFTWVVLAVFVEKTETLTWRSADHYVGFGDFRLRFFEDIHYIADSTMIAEISIVSLCRIIIKIIRPYRFKVVTGHLS